MLSVTGSRMRPSSFGSKLRGVERYTAQSGSVRVVECTEACVPSTGPLSSGSHPPGLHFFWVWALTFLIFSCCSFVLFLQIFLFLDIFSYFHFFFKKNFLFYICSFFKFGRRREANPNLKLVWERRRGYYLPNPNSPSPFPPSKRCRRHHANSRSPCREGTSEFVRTFVQCAEMPTSMTTTSMLLTWSNPPLPLLPPKPPHPPKKTPKKQKTINPKKKQKTQKTRI